MRPLYVVKVGSSTLDRETIQAELAALSARGARVLLVAGGATGIARHFASIGRPMPQLTLVNGDPVRYCPPAELSHLIEAYERVTLPAVAAGLERLGLSTFTAVAARGALVSGKTNWPLRVTSGDGRARVVRDHRAGVPTAANIHRLTSLLDAYDLVCLSPPVADWDGGGPLNVDADMLAAFLANTLAADHVRLVTGTAGLLTDPARPGSTLPHAHPGEAMIYARGRMRQKVRAAELALTGSADVAITGPHTLGDPAGWTRFWREPGPAADVTLLSRAVAIPSVSKDEHELAAYLRDWCLGHGIDVSIDEVGNLVALKGRPDAVPGARLLLLGHLDTVPVHWPVSWQDEELSGRGSVDAKASLACFLEVLAATDVPPGGQLRVVGAVEEEISSSKGAFHVRDHYPADAVVIGEPSGSGTLTLGYFGLFKLEVTATVPVAHSAGRNAVSAPDALFELLNRVRSAVGEISPEALSAVIDIGHQPGGRTHRAVAILNFRVPPSANLEALQKAAIGQAKDGAQIRVLRATPGISGGRSSSLAKIFIRAFTQAEIRPRFVVKKGTSDMNTLATTWSGVPMVAYGPGDPALDHTDAERIGVTEYRTARATLTCAVKKWFATTQQGSQ